MARQESPKERVRSYLVMLRTEPHHSHWWEEYKKEVISKEKLKEVVEQCAKGQTLDNQEDEIFLGVVLEEMKIA